MTFDISKTTEDIPESGWIEVEAHGHKSAIFTCPKCGIYVNLGAHKIYDDGTLDASVLHNWPYWNEQLQIFEERCGFHEMIRLLEWNP